MSFLNYSNKSNIERLNQFMGTLAISNRTPEYYVNWKKVEENTREFELELNTLNYLLGKKNIREEAVKLFSNNPNLLKAIPTLIASRDREIDVLLVEDDNMNISSLNFLKPDIKMLNDYMEFISKSGLLSFMKNNITRNLVDYVYGVEAGLDSNARKNRSGTTMESIINHFVVEVVTENPNFSSMSQATASRIKQAWDIDVPVDKSSRRYDEAIFDKKNHHLYLIETNYYGGGGSKLKAVAGEFSELNELITQRDNISFIWITDGKGWNTARLPLEEAFHKIDYIFNLDMLKNDYLKQLLSLR